ncbi:PREDICTED: pro-cathepsin H-like [Priapulus caudatus]|uniref:Pro-cathepsin H-like n=1 Tax=Priapulus caudatus TaxID=37621 RepID=A0ABM1ELI3_PRICU|nr:PREDICTED: pro-cathepsin H-like [Priapulus caudatus]
MTSAIEAGICLDQGALPSLSEQVIVDCCGGYYTHGCSGGSVIQAFDCVYDLVSMPYDSNYAYTAKKGTCKYTYGRYIPLYRSQPFYYSNKDGDGEDMLSFFVCYAPTIIAIAVPTNNDRFYMYRGGIIDEHTACGKTINHAVVAVGIGEENGVPYWLVLNSWGTQWGEDGFVRIKRGDGICSVGDYSVVPPMSH